MQQKIHYIYLIDICTYINRGNIRLKELIKDYTYDISIDFDNLILEIQKELYNIARSRLTNDDDIADAIQETILKSYKNFDKIKEKKYLKTYIIRILINECTKIYRHNKKHKISYEYSNLDNYISIEDERRKY